MVEGQNMKTLMCNEEENLISASSICGNMENQKINHNDIKRKILRFLYDNQGNKSVSSGMIRNAIYQDYELKLSQVEQYLKNLHNSRYVGKESKKTLKLEYYSSINYVEYFITQKGIKYVENNFEEDISLQGNTLITGNIYFGDVYNTTYNIQEIINKEIDDEKIKEKVKGYFEELKCETSQENVNKKRIKELLLKIGEIGISKLSEAAFGFLIKQFLNI